MASTPLEKNLTYQAGSPFLNPRLLILDKNLETDFFLYLTFIPALLVYSVFYWQLFHQIESTQISRSYNYSAFYLSMPVIFCIENSDMFCYNFPSMSLHFSPYFRVFCSTTDVSCSESTFFYYDCSKCFKQHISQHI